jgi:hypothetical protein
LRRGRLPNEAEWNFAAAGGSEQRFYPLHFSAVTSAVLLICRRSMKDGCHLLSAIFGCAPEPGAGRRSLGSFACVDEPTEAPDREVSEVLCLGPVYFSSLGSDFAKAR